MKIPYMVQIEGTDNGGFIVTVGCRTLTYQNREALLDALALYTANPREVAEQYAQTFEWPDGDPLAAPSAPQPFREHRGGGEAPGAPNRGFRTASEVVSGEQARVTGGGGGLEVPSGTIRGR